MKLSEMLAAKKKLASEKIPTEKWDVMSKSTQSLVDSNFSRNALKEGDTIIDFRLPNIKGEIIHLSKLLETGDVVLSFYRGGWCPYCNLELKALQAILPQLKAHDTHLVAITPETPDNSLTTSEKNELTFDVLSDLDNEYAKQLGLVFQMTTELQEVYASFGLDVAKHNNNQDFELPMPATYLINREGTIVYSFVPEDYTERLDPEAILECLKVKEK